MKFEHISKENQNHQHDVSKNYLINQKIEYNETDIGQQQQNIFTTQQKQNLNSKIVLQFHQLNESKNYINPKNNPQLHVQKQVGVRDIFLEPLPKNIYLMRDYLSNFKPQEDKNMFLDKYQSKYKITPSTNSSKKSPELMSFLLLKSMTFIKDEKQTHSDILDFMDKYKLRRIQVTQHERVFHNSQNKDLNLSQSQSGLVFVNVSLKFRQIQQWAAEVLKISDVSSNDLLALITKQFFLFITSNYKILKQNFNEQSPVDNISKTQQYQTNEKSNEETQSYIQSQITRNSNFIDEFKNFKTILESQKNKGKQIEDEEQQSDERFEKNQINQYFNQNCVKLQENEQKEIELSSINYQYSSNQDQNPLDNNKKQTNVIDNEDLNLQILQNKKSSSQTSDNKKKRTNNFYNLPRYFMTLILELLSEENLKELGLQDGFIQIISRISNNLMQQGKKSEKTKSNFYNHQHYNCLFLILKDDQSKKQHYSKQIEELYKKVYGVNNIYCQFNTTYINCFKVVISQIIKLQLNVMQDLQLTSYILENSSLYPFEKSKINYISRVIEGIDKLNAGLNIHRF